MEKHTPGPWKVVSITTGCVGRDIDGFYMVASAYPNGLYHPEMVANAHLIAAAPELLGALECSRAMDLLNCEGTSEAMRLFALEVLEKHGYDQKGPITYQQFVCEKTDAAIAKARGQS